MPRSAPAKPLPPLLSLRRASAHAASSCGERYASASATCSAATVSASASAAIVRAVRATRARPRPESGNRSTARESSASASLVRDRPLRPRAAATRGAIRADASDGPAASSTARGRGIVTTRSKRSSSARESLSRYAAKPLPRARALRGRIATRAARAEVHRRDELKAGREDRAAGGARDRDDAVLERLAQRLERRPRELRQLVEQQDAAMREARLAGTDARAAADDRRGRRAVVRRAERRRRDERLLDREQPGHRVDPRHLECRRRLERRQQPGQAAREHRLPRSRRPGEQQVVPARGGDLERAPRALLSSDVREVGQRRRVVSAWRHDRVRLELAAQVRDRVGEVPHRDRLDAGERRLGRRLARAEHPLEPHAPRTLGDREHAADAAQAPVERELADGRVPVELVVRELLRRREHRERDRQVVARPLLAEAGRSEVDGDPAARELQLGRGDAALDALARLSAGAVGQADDHEGRRAVLDVRLHLDATRLETDESMGDRACKHLPTLRGKPSPNCQSLRTTSTSSKYSPARRPVRRLT